MIVVDTSVLIDFFRGRDLPGAERLRRLEEEQTPFALPAICCQEVLQGARDQLEWDLLLEYLESQELLFPRALWSTHRNAARIFYDCRRKDLTIRSSVDCFIAQLVLETDSVLLHNDEDFE
ncbi:MAG TPA: PIN domain-containing protein, partial [Thermoanaerobaculia bacterium]|nr:PIN domain-containing protein [Thermoanaerobaculia bacterium]